MTDSTTEKTFESTEELQRLIDECETIRPYLEKLPEKQLPAWVYNLWYSALLEVRDLRGEERDATGSDDSECDTPLLTPNDREVMRLYRRAASGGQDK